jgi:signal peptidase
MKVTHILKRLSSSLLTAIIAVSCVAFVLFGSSASGWKALSVPTGSMQPAIQAGSLVLVRRVPASSLKLGDVITYTNPLDARKTISHRIIKMYLVGDKVRGFITKGDANQSPDIPVTSGRVIGKVVWHIPYIGYGLLAAKKPWVILPIVYLAALPIILEELKRLSDYYKRSLPYRLFGYRPKPVQEHSAAGQRFAVGAVLTIFAVVIIGAFTAPIALAMLKSNTVSLTHNTITVARSLPTNKDQCKNGGWKKYGVFKNQGDCVSFVATHGKNPPAN